MREDNIDRVWMVFGVGALQLVMGILGALDTALVGRSGSLLAMNPMHGTAHAVGGVIAIGFALRGHVRATATLAYGALFLLGAAVNIATPDLWGMMTDVPANTGIHAMHLTFSLLTLAAGALALRAPARVPALR